MAFDPVKIPQNVYVEDRVIGPITLRQIFMLLGGGATSYALWAACKQAGYVNLAAGTIAVLPSIIMVLFAFVKISQISLARFCLLMIEKGQKPHIRYWQPRSGIEIRLFKQSIQKSEAKEDITPEKKNVSEIDQLSSMLDSKVLENTPQATPVT